MSRKVRWYAQLDAMGRRRVFKIHIPPFHPGVSIWPHADAVLWGFADSRGDAFRMRLPGRAGDWKERILAVNAAPYGEQIVSNVESQFDKETADKIDEWAATARGIRPGTTK